MTRPGGGPGLIPRPVAAVIAIVVTAVWALNVAADVFVADYQSNAEINTAFMVVVGVVFALGRGKSTTEDDDPPTPPSPPPTNPEPEPDTPLPPGSMSVAELLARLAQERGDSR